MAGINPISGATPSVGPRGLTGTAHRDEAAEKSSFGDTLRNYISKVDGDQRASSTAIADLLTGTSEDILPVVSAVAKADLSFKLLMGVRNKVIEAYKQTINMQV